MLIQLNIIDIVNYCIKAETARYFESPFYIGPGGQKGKMHKLSSHPDANLLNFNLFSDWIQPYCDREEWIIKC